MIEGENRLKLGKLADTIGFPVVFNGDRLDAFRLGVNTMFELACKELDFPAAPKVVNKKQEKSDEKGE